MSNSPRCLALLFTVALGCGSGTPPADLQKDAGGVQTGIEGIVRRGPIQPVCQVGIECDAPFSARFEVLQEGRVVGHFNSDTAGHFRIRLAPGSYTIVPDESAPLMSPRSQGKQVIVGPTGLTSAALDFDTGIR